MTSRLTTAILIGLLVVAGNAVADPPETKSMTNYSELEYTITFDANTEQIWIEVKNPTDEEVTVDFHIKVDQRFIVSEESPIQSGKTHSFTYDLTRGVDVTREKHNAEFIGGQQPLWFNYTKEIDSPTTDDYPIPKITNISLGVRRYQGESRTMINVTAHNPSSRIWMPLIRAYTLETTGFYSPLRLPPNSTESTTILLKEKSGKLVAGEVRLYIGKLSESNGAFDQVEIKGRSNEETQWSHEEYETVVPPWEDEEDHYVYENKSVHREKIGAPQTIQESPIAWFVGAVLLVIGYTRVKKYRR